MPMSDVRISLSSQKSHWQESHINLSAYMLNE